MKTLGARRRLFINGKWIQSQNFVTLKSPYTLEPIAEIPNATDDELELAIAAAYSARETMRKMPIHQRSTILERLVSLLSERFEEAAQLIALEAAKPIRTAREEVKRTIQTYKFAAGEANRIGGETLPLDAAPGGENRLAYTVREPLGVVGAITPFNFPMNLVAHKIGPAIATGNSIVLKPATQTPLSAFFLAELLQEAGLPDGALNVVTGSGRVVGEGMVVDNRVNMITFTGSPEVGIGIRNKAGLKRVTLELGSNAAVILDKGIQIEKVVKRCVQGAFSNQGQVCISLQRIYVHEEIYQEFVNQFVAETKRLKVGDPLNEETDVSALISQNDVTRSLTWIQEAKDGGADILTGGYADGTVLLPTVIVNVNPNLNVSCQEVFAPIVIINKINRVQEAVEQVNNSRYGLQAGIYTNDINLALEAIEQLEVGGVLVNDIPTFRVDHMPYGGVKESGTGKEGIKYAIEEMTEMKLVVINRN